MRGTSLRGVRAWWAIPAFAVVACVGAIAAIPVLAASGDGSGTVTICHAVGGGGFVIASAPESDFTGVASGHGRHDDDIVPPFTIENPGPEDSSSFSGRNWDDQGQQIFNRGCADQPPAPEPPEPSKKVRICHASSSHSNPYVVLEPAIANNGDLSGGHLNHTGPVYPESGWGDIIPPYQYVDADGVLRTFAGYNWSDEGQAIYGNGCDPPTPPDPDPVVPVLECVEAADDGFLAHFGYSNPNAATVEPPSSENSFSPEPGNRGQPAEFGPGAHSDVFQVSWDGSALTWNLMGQSVTASSESHRCAGGSLTVVKQLLPSDDPGRFSLRIDGNVEGGASEVGSGGTTGTVAVPGGRHTVGETAAAGTSLADYRTQIVCRGGGGDGDVVSNGSGTSLDVSVPKGAAIVCTITNEAKENASAVSPVLQCVVFDGNRPALADWGYRNSSGVPVAIPVGNANHFAPLPAFRDQPLVFQAGSFSGVFQTAFGGEDALTWTLSGHSLTADAGSPRCTGTVEVQKTVAPSSDSGVFRLVINGHSLASGGDGTTTGPVTVGVGEATVAEIAGAGTSMAEYDSSVLCARNGTIEVSAPGAKVDVSVRNGDVVVCRFTNTRKGTPPTPNPNPPEPTPTPPTPIPPTPPDPKPLLDLEVVKNGEPAAVRVGGRIRWTMTVTNRSSVTAADVNGLKVNDPRSFRTKLISLTASQGTCRPYVCDLGRLAPGSSATVVAVTRALEVGPVVDVVRVSSEEVESNYRNNVASALVRVVGTFTPPTPVTVCRTLTAAPRALQAQRTSVVLLTARNRLGRPLVAFPVRARGAGIVALARTDRRGVARMTVAPARIGLVGFAGGRRPVLGGRPTCVTVLAALAVEGTRVTG